MPNKNHQTEKSHNWLSRFWKKGIAQKLLIVFVALVVVMVGTMYGIAQWYIHTQKGPQTLGVSFIPQYAEYLGVNPQQTMDGLISIGVRNFRLVSYWDTIEPEPGKYDFSQLDWQFKKAEAANAKITLSVGLRQPRWPECHAPSWVDINQPSKQWQPQLEQFMTQVVNRYKDSPALKSYQVENEFFLVGFGNCPNKERSRLVNEYNLVKHLDLNHKVIISRSNNGLGIPIGAPKPDEYGVSVYKRVWDAQITHRYLEYPMPAWYYAFLAGAQKLHDGNNMIVHELQAEAWGPAHQDIKSISLDEQNKSLNAQRLQDRFEYGKATGMREIYLWGAEYWYYRKVLQNDPSLWNVAQQQFSQN